MDYEARLKFCNWFKQMYAEIKKFLSRTLWTDIEIFPIAGNEEVVYSHGQQDLWI